LAAPAAAVGSLALAGKSMVMKAGDVATNPPGTSSGASTGASDPMQESPMKQPPSYSSRS
jgi:hypothetical protein